MTGIVLLAIAMAGGIIMLAWGGIDMANAYKHFHSEEKYRKDIAGAAKKAAIGVGLVGITLPIAYIFAMSAIYHLLDVLSTLKL